MIIKPNINTSCYGRWVGGGLCQAELIVNIMKYENCTTSNVRESKLDRLLSERGWSSIIIYTLHYTCTTLNMIKYKKITYLSFFLLKIRYYSSKKTTTIINWKILFLICQNMTQIASIIS